MACAPNHRFKQVRNKQPAAVADTLRGRVNGTNTIILDEMRIEPAILRSIDKIIVVACGTAAYAGHVAKYAIEHLNLRNCV